MIVEVIPVVKLPRSVIAIYSYSVSKALEDQVWVGQVVEVNFRGREILAIVINHKNTENKKTKKHKFGLKEFDRIVIDQPIVTKEQINLIFWMSDYYYLSPALLAKSLVPKIPKRHKKTKTQKHSIPEQVRYGAADKNTRDIVGAPLVGALGQDFYSYFLSENNRQLCFYSFEDEKLKEYEKEIAKNLNNKKQTLIVVPTIYDLELLKNKLVERGFREEYIIGITAQQGIKEEFEKWLEILSGRPRIIMATKIGVFYPFNNLGSIIIDQSESWDHKQSDINPRYDTRTVGLMLGNLHKCRVYFGSLGHRLEDFRFQISNFRFNQTLTRNQKDKLKIIDLKNVYKTKDFALISDPLHDAIETTLKRGEKIFLFLNRKGQGTSTVCNNCGYIFKCVNCQLPLVLHDENRLKCHYCDRWQEMPPFCPVCQGPDIRSFGQGTQRVEKYIKKIFTGVNVLRLDKDISKKPNFQFPISNFQLVIGTEYALNRIDWSEIGLVGVLNADAGLVVPDFRAAERTYQLLRRIVVMFTGVETRRCLVSRPGMVDNYDQTIVPRIKTRQRLVSTRQIIIQTYHPDSHIIRAIENNRPDIFYDEELKIRKELGYPPFVRLIKLIYRDQSKKKTAYMADRLYRNLVRYQKRQVKLGFKTQLNEVEILEPVRAYVEKVRGRYKYYIILKIPIGAEHQPLPVLRDTQKHENTKTRKHNINDLIKIVPDDWVVDVEPESLL